MQENISKQSSPKNSLEDLQYLNLFRHVFSVHKHTLRFQDLQTLEDCYQREQVRTELDQPYGYELVVALKELGFRLNPYLELLLSEISLSDHHKARYGNGVMRASMWIGKYAKMPIGSLRRQEIFRNGFARAALSILRNEEEDLSGTTDSRVHKIIPDIEKVYGEDDLIKLKDVLNKLTKPGNRLLAQMIVQLFFPVSSNNEIPYIDTNKRNGSCSDAERAFQMIADLEGPYFGSTKGVVTVYVDEKGVPVLIEKTKGYGDPYSAINLEKITLNGVEFPVGTLVATEQESNAPFLKSYSQKTKTEVRVKLLKNLRGIDPIRLSIFSLEEPDREEAFAPFIYMDPSINISHLQTFCSMQKMS